MIFEGLNAEQRRAVEAVRGPVCILAGAGSGKTTTITRRIANQVATGAFAPDQILAVTFTDKAATEMRERLAVLGAGRVPARTFHSAALAQLHYFAGSVGEVLASKASILLPIARSLPVPFRYRPLADLATEIEWAKNRRLTPDTYRRSLGDHEPPVPDDVMERVFRTYEARKTERGLIDFEDLLEQAVRMYDEDPNARAAFQERYQAFTVDEYQDVNLLQQSLLERWVGDRDDLCVVGDDYQSIYSFTGATPEYLLGMPERFPGALVVRLEENYRSTPEILSTANRLVPELGGSEKVLRAVLPSGPEPLTLVQPDRQTEAEFIVSAGAPPGRRGRPVRGDGGPVPPERALGGLRGGVRPGRHPVPGARRSVHPPPGRAANDSDAARSARRFSNRRGHGGSPQTGLDSAPSQRPRRRGADPSGRPVPPAFARGAAPTGLVGRGFPPRPGGPLQRRNPGPRRRAPHVPPSQGPRVGSGLPPAPGGEGAPVRQGDARRPPGRGAPPLLRRHDASEALADDHVDSGREAEPLPGGAGRGRRSARPKAEKPAPTPEFEALRRWRAERAKTDEVPAYVVFHDSTLHEIAAVRPQTREQLSTIAGIGPAKLERYADDLLEALATI